MISKFKTLAAGAVCALAASTSFGVVLQMETFDNPANVVTRGSGVVDNGVLRATDIVNSQFGSGVLVAPAAMAQDMTVKFDFTFDPTGGNGEADGGSFLILPNTVGPLDGGGGLNDDFPGNAENPSIAGALALTFDIHDLGPANPGIRLKLGGTDLTAQLNPSFDFSNNQFHQAILDIEFVGGGANVSLGIVEDSLGTPGAVESIFTDVFAAGFNQGDFRYGFAARTGGQNAFQAIDNLMVLDNAIPEPTTAALGLIGLAGLVARRRRTA